MTDLQSLGVDTSNHTIADRFMLYVLINNGPMNSDRIANHMGCSTRQVRQCSNRLKSSGVIGSFPDPKDPRSTLYEARL